MRQCFALVLSFFCSAIFAQTAIYNTPFEDNTQATATYAEAMDFYKKLDAGYLQMRPPLAFGGGFQVRRI
jgi:hypothetical protein